MCFLIKIQFGKAKGILARELEKRLSIAKGGTKIHKQPYQHVSEPHSNIRISIDH